MATSQNGWSANDRAVIASYTVPNTSLRISLRRGDVSVVLLEYLRRYHLEVEPLPHNPQDLWGFAERLIIGSATDLSNHASGTAVDCRATAHPLAKVGTFTATQLAALNKLLAWFEGVIRHGKDYTGRKDEMHAEINAGAAAVTRIANKIRAAAGKPATPAPTPAAAAGPTLQLGSTGAVVSALQKFMHDTFPSYVHYTPTGNFLAQTKASIEEFQRRTGLTADGIVGPNTYAMLARYGYRPA